MNIAFYVSGKAERLKKILEQDDPVLIGSIKLIFSDDAQNLHLEKTAAKLGIYFHCLDFSTIEKTNNNSKSMTMSDELRRLMNKHKIDYCFSFGAHLLVGELLNEYENRIINFHPSILPMHPGLSSIDQAVAAGNNFLIGNTAHFIDAGIDTGPIIMQSVMSIKVFEESGYNGILDKQIPMFKQIFKWLNEDRINVNDSVVIIKGVDTTKASFFPSLEIRE